jgi:hypothetical protein
MNKIMTLKWSLFFGEPMSNNYSPNVIKGDTITWAMGFSGPTGGAYNLSGMTFTMEVRRTYYPGKEILKYVLGVTSGSQFLAVDGITGGLALTGLTGILYITVGSNYTKQFPPYVPVFYDIQMQYPNNGGITTVLRGTLNTILDVTEN